MGLGSIRMRGALIITPLSNLDPKQIRQKSRDLLKVNERLVKEISRLKSMKYQLQQYLYDKATELQFQESHNNKHLKEMGLYTDSQVKVIQEINSAETTKNNSELREIASARQSDKKASNLVSTFYVIDKSLTRTTCSTSALLFIFLSVIYKVINQLYDERNLLHTSINKNVEEAHMTVTDVQLDAVTTVHAKRSVSVHNINAITAKRKLLMNDSSSP